MRPLIAGACRDSCQCRQCFEYARLYAHSSFSSLVQSLLPKDTLLRTYLIPPKQRYPCARVDGGETVTRGSAFKIFP